MKKMTKSIHKDSETQFINNCTAVAKAAALNLAALAPYGITDLAPFLSGISKFSSLCTVARNLTADRIDATQNIIDSVKSAMTLVRDEIDPAVFSLIGFDNYVNL